MAEPRAAAGADACLPELFARAAREHPERTALLAPAGSLSFGELDARANALAAWLRARGCGYGDRVALRIPRSPGMAVAVLAVWRIGAVYVAIAGAQSREAARYIERDSGARLTLVSAVEPDWAACFARAQALETALAEAAAHAPHERTARAARPDDAAWIYYTSGSSGRPKGVLGTHRGGLNRCAWMWRTQPLGADEVCVQQTGLHVIDAIWELWGPLARGVPVVLPPDDCARDPLRLLRLLRAFRVTRICMVPSLLHALLAGFPDLAARLPDLRLWVVSGEALSAALIETFASALPGRTLVNQYGLTESSADVMFVDSAEMIGGAAGPASIGRPIDGVRARVLDRAGDALAPGGLGELGLSGACLTLGYWGDPRRTAQKYVPDPDGTPGARLFRTGDLVVERPGGSFDYAGRADRQVKVRGYRIELDGIESACRELPGVESAAAVVFEPRPGERELALFAAGRGLHDDGAAARIRAGLREKLPEWMLPARIAALAALPHTAGGKLDRRALVAGLERAAAERAAQPGAPAAEPAAASDGAAKLRAIWQRLLGPQTIADDADFFELGGNSLLMIGLIVACEAEFGLEIPLEEAFEIATIAQLAAWFDARRASAPPRPAGAALGPTPRGPASPLAPAQERLWFLDQLHPGSAAYNEVEAVRVRGPLDLGALAGAFAALLARHESLRTRFAMTDGAPVQIVEPGSAARVTLLADLSGLPAAERERALARTLLDQADRPFDLAADPLIRAHAVRLGEAEHVLLFTVHHIVADGWSMEQLLQQLGALYALRARGADARLTPLPVQYADYALWQRRELNGERARAQLAYWRAQLAYWRAQLAGSPELELPADRPRPALPSYRGASVPLEVPAGLREDLARLGRTESATLFMVLLAAYALLLRKYGDQTDIAIGLPVAGRGRPEVAELIGLFINMLVVRLRVDDSWTVREYLRAARAVALEAYARQDVPFEKLVEALQPERHLARQPLFQVSFVLQDIPSPGFGGPGLEVERVDVQTRTSKFDLTLFLAQAGAALRGRIEYSTDLFDERSVVRLGEYWLALLRGMVERPDAPLAALALMSADERRHLVEQANPSFHPLEPALVPPPISAQAARTPHAIAVEGPDARLTYAELEERANRLAHHLRANGVGPESVVGVCLRRSAAMVVALLGILKAGGAYLPLDPAYPPERLSFMLRDAGAALLVTDTPSAEIVPPAAGIAQVRIDTDWDARVAGLPAVAPGPRARPENLAYVIYTSGSTGKPKGVAVTQRALHGFLAAFGEQVALDGADRLLAVTSLGFDIAGLELLAPLAHGARVVVAPAETAASGAALADAIERFGITVLQATPGVYRLLFDAGWKPPRGLRLLCGGEALAADLAAELHAAAAAAFNLYGPTEATIWSTCRRLDGAGPVSLGRPLANTRAYVLDERLEPVVPGAAGEIYLGGAGLARGYHGRPGLTAASFLPDPFLPGERMYRTGDRGRLRADGELEFLGRTDHQLKLRGYRIEPGEIEALLREIDGVRDAVVVARADRAGTPQLVAYLAWSGARPPRPEELRRRLARELPAHMLPAAFVPLAELPLSPNGKLDRSGLPEPRDEHFTDAAHDRRPLSPVEEVLAEIWASVLDFERIGRDDDFFRLGGHSLLAAKLVTRMRAVFGPGVSLRELFQTPTVRETARRIEAARDRAAPAPAPLPAASGSSGPLAPAQERLWFLEQLHPGSAVYNEVEAVRVRGPLDLDALACAFAALLRRHESLRTRFAVADGVPLQVVEPEPAARIERIADLAALAPPEREAALARALLDEADRPFDLATGPLVRAGLVRMAESEHVLVFTLHHLVADGWSIERLLEQLGTAYAQCARGADADLPPLPVRYLDYALAQRHGLDGARTRDQLAYWRAQLAGVPELELPTDRPRPAQPTYRGSSVPLAVPGDLRERLARLGRAEGATPFMVLLGAYALLLRKYGDQTDIAIGLPVANRDRPEVAELIGLFINMLVARLRLNDRWTVREYLREVRTVALDAYAHQDVPFEKLVEALQPDRDLARQPLFQVSFVLQDVPSTGFGAPGLEAERVDVQTRTSKFDLTLFLAQAGDGLRGRIEYNSDLFDERSVVRLGEYWLALLRAMADAPDARLSELSLLSPGEQRGLREAWSSPPRAVEPGLVPALVRAQAERTPHAIAVEGPDARLTYAELEERANRLAHHLRARGVGPETVVGLCLRRSAAMVVALLAILKAGGAYLPLDPTYPPERLSFMLHDAGAALLVTDTPSAEIVPPAAGIAQVRIDTDWDACIAGLPAAAPEPRARPENLAYVIYTSGSTGKPKGVAVTHRSVVELLVWARSYFRPEWLTAGLCATSLSFDPSVFEIFVPLVFGGRTVIVDGLADLARPAVRDAVSMFVAVPSAIPGLIEQNAIGPSVKLIVLGSEKLPATVARAVLARGGIERLQNVYGPTEDTLFSTTTPVGANGERDPALGRPVANTRVYVLDDDLEPVAPGAVGEIYVGGRGSARGYHGKPGLTAARFRPDRFVPGERMYRTGDRGRLRADGELEFLGRTDHQVKLRGYRIEPGEIEALLREINGVRDAVVVARADRAGTPQLVAYLTASGPAPLRSGTVRRELARHVPAYMLPAAFVPLAELPLSPNGKLDRARLPAPERAHFADDAQPEAGGTTVTQAQVARVWQELLGLDALGLDEDFFDLGGHSLLALKSRARLSELLGCDVPLKHHYLHRTARAFARALDDAPPAH